MIKLFVAKLRQEENQDNIGKALKDIVLMRFSMMAKYIVRYVGLFLLALFAVVALIALPIIAVIAVIYNRCFWHRHEGGRTEDCQHVPHFCR